MRVRFTRETFTGTRTRAPGDEAELATDQAKRVIGAGNGLPVTAEEHVETAELPDAGGDERATIPTRRKGKGK
jgi:hypothetical protein